MSGGLYGRRKAPERACLRVEFWPADDARAWTRACTPGSLLDDEIGARSGHRAIGNRKDEKGYGRWLTHLSFHEPGVLACPPADRITPERVRGYVLRLGDLGGRSATILARLQELGAMARVLDAGRDWSFINRLASKVRAQQKPARDKSCRHLSHELMELGFALMSDATEHDGLESALTYRDGLLIAFLAILPLRRRNLANLVLERTLIPIGAGFEIGFDEDEMKTGAPLEFALPDILVEPLRHYLEHGRDLLAARTGRWSRPLNGALWVSKDGSPMTQMALYDVIRKRTAAAFGEPINPHHFRHTAATTMAIASPRTVRAAAPLLGHRTFTTTERHYQQAKGLEAHRALVDVLQQVREATDE